VSRSGVTGLMGQGVVCALRRTGGTDIRRGTLFSLFLVGSSSENVADRFGPGWVALLAGFESTARVVLEFIAD
jgi:hypothetical protein